jgi:DNA polymerase-3 subunit delta
VVTDSGIFYSRQYKHRLIDKAWQAYQSGDVKKAANYLMTMLGLLDLNYRDVSRENRRKTLKYDFNKTNGEKWLDDVIDFCRESNLSPLPPADEGGALQKAIEKGFPRGNHLIIITETTDEKRNLYKSIRKHGMVIDCSVPKGDRRADKSAQQAVLSERLNAILSENQKSIDRDAWQMLYEMTGFHLRTFTQNVEKLISFVGERKRITRGDVKFVVQRTKKDPIYAFTNAVTDKNVDEALFYLESLYFDGSQSIRPEQILVAITNQVRKLILIKSFVKSARGDSWYASCSYGDFKKSVLPAIKESDKHLIEQVTVWQDILAADDRHPNKRAKKLKKRGGRSGTELLVAKNPHNPYPVYQMFKKSENFTEEHLFNALESLNRADLRIKTSAADKKLVLEEAIINICR